VPLHLSHHIGSFLASYTYMPLMLLLNPTQASSKKDEHFPNGQWSL
jgi:hypothetical protein